MSADFLPAVLPDSIRWSSENSEDSSDCYHTLVNELRRNGDLNDPRAPNYRLSSLDEYIRSEVQRSVTRIRMLRRLVRPLDGPMRTADDLRRLGRVLAEIAFTAAQAAAARELEMLDREPTKLANAIKHHCAEEAFYLIGCFSSEPMDHLNNLQHGAFHVVTKLLYEAVTDELDADVFRACDRLLRNWRQFGSMKMIRREHHSLTCTDYSNKIPIKPLADWDDSA